VDNALIQTVARELLGLTLTDAEAALLVEPLVALQQLVQAIETVPLPYSADPFITPRSSDEWLETWPEQ
jgi:hypothetical protein